MLRNVWRTANSTRSARPCNLQQAFWSFCILIQVIFPELAAVFLQSLLFQAPLVSSRRKPLCSCESKYSTCIRFIEWFWKELVPVAFGILAPHRLESSPNYHRAKRWAQRWSWAPDFWAWVWWNWMDFGWLGRFYTGSSKTSCGMQLLVPNCGYRFGKSVLQLCKLRGAAPVVWRALGTRKGISPWRTTPFGTWSPLARPSLLGCRVWIMQVCAVWGLRWNHALMVQMNGSKQPSCSAFKI